MTLKVLVFGGPNTNSENIITKLMGMAMISLSAYRGKFLHTVHQLPYTMQLSPLGQRTLASIPYPYPESTAESIPQKILDESDCLIYCLDLARTVHATSLNQQLMHIRTQKPTMPILLVGVNIESATPEQLASFLTTQFNPTDLVSERFLIAHGASDRLAPVDRTTFLTETLLNYACRQHFDSAKKILFESLTKHKMPEATQQALMPIIDRFLFQAKNNRILADTIGRFKDECTQLLNQHTHSFPAPSILDAIQCFLINFIWIALLATLLGFSAGFFFGVWASPCAFIMTALQLYSAANIVLTSALALATWDAGHRLYGLFHPVELAKNDITLFAEYAQDHRRCI